MQRYRNFILTFAGLVVATGSITTLCIRETTHLNAAESKTQSQAQSPKTIDFARDVRPILSDRCFFCHGPDKAKQKAKLRLDTRAGAFAKTRLGDTPNIITPGKPLQSELYLRLTAEFEDELMPPTESKITMSKKQIETIRLWIEQGATWEDTHWSYRPLKSPALPAVPHATTSPALSKATISKWSKNPIDRFVLARMTEQALVPSRQASKETLIRRVTFDLTGLPPTSKQIDAFIADESKNAFEKVVDRLLKSSAYGERMAADWLDIARYSDTYGFQVDRDRFVWPWRDWVIKAFNKNQPYNEFVTWQLAGDLLPNATDEQILATTFNRLHPQKVEGGSVPEEFRVEYVADRTHTFATAFLGMTLECARCHDHKYDPISQADYYQFFAYFNHIDEAGLYSYFTSSVPTPTLKMTDAAGKQRIAAAEKAIEVAEKKLVEVKIKSGAAFNTWLAKRPAARAQTNKAAAPNILGRVAHLDFEKASGVNPIVAGRVGKAVKLTGDDAYNLKVGNFRRFDPFSVSLWINTPDVKKRAVVFHRSRAWTDAGSRGYELLLEEGKLSAALIHFWPGNAIRVRTRDAIATNQWLHVTITYDGSSRAGGIGLFVNGKPSPIEIVRDHLNKNITGGGGNNIAIGARFRDRGFKAGLVDEFKVFNRQLTPLEVGQLAGDNALQAALATPATKLTAKQKHALFSYYLAAVDKTYAGELAKVRSAREKHSKTVDGLTEIMVMQEMDKPRKTFVLKRGAYDSPAQEVRPAPPAAISKQIKTQASNRFGLANWLTDPKNPLTPRVTVNRLWQMLFAQGLVRTPEDFGSQGALPTHPLLLDWLAHDFITHDWDVKRLIKQMVMSAAYQQSSQVTAQLLKRDPENIFLARAPSFRMSAEMLRDNALAVSGLLVNKIGGPPAKPYEVETSFKPSKRSKGEGLYRRSVYTYWKRTAPAPAMMILDASKRDVCRPRREQTSSPLQAFVMLNGPQFVEASRVLAQQAIKQHKENAPATLSDIFRKLTSRAIAAKELVLVQTLYDNQLKHFRDNPNKAVGLLKVGDAKADPAIDKEKLAAMTIVANTLMNYHECVMRR